eukprot:COSAG01_NODE_1721_length_9391_cov_5.427249_4_plen_222_part_00
MPEALRARRVNRPSPSSEDPATATPPRSSASGLGGPAPDPASASRGGSPTLSSTSAAKPLVVVAEWAPANELLAASRPWDTVGVAAGFHAACEAARRREVTVERLLAEAAHVAAEPGRSCRRPPVSQNGQFCGFTGEGRRIDTHCDSITSGVGCRHHHRMSRACRRCWSSCCDALYRRRDTMMHGGGRTPVSHWVAVPKELRARRPNDAWGRPDFSHFSLK